VQLSEGYFIEFGGQFEAQRSATRLITGLAGFSVAGIFVDLPRGTFDAKLASVAAVVLMIAVGGTSVWYAVRRLQRFEIGEST
jgi:Cu/Ag efflux pump CusA